MMDLERTRQALADGTFRRLREASGMSIAQAERSYDIDQGNLTRYERGLTRPHTRTLGRLSRALADLERMEARREAVAS
jgi:transcriptional regulator with XRE-family HTH domain